MIRNGVCGCLGQCGSEFFVRSLSSSGSLLNACPKGLATACAPAGAGSWKTGSAARDGSSFGTIDNQMCQPIPTSFSLRIDFARHECDEIRDASKRDGLIDVPPGGCPDGFHKVAYAIQDNKNDYYWLRESENGKSWCHKFCFYDKPSNLDGSRKVITDPSTANLNFPQIGRQPAGNYKFCKDGYLCAPNSWTDAK